MAIDGDAVADPASHPTERCPWLALADGAAAAALATGPGAARLQRTTDALVFAAALAERRPRVVVLGCPPAGPAELELALRERRRRPAMRILHVTPVDAVEARLAAIRSGVDDAVDDAIDPLELLGRLELLDARASMPARHELAVTEDIVLDLVAHEARRDGRQLHLRPKEFQLLALLAANPGRAYTRRQILDRVWGPGHDGDPRTVDVHVRWLRSKVEPDGRAPTHLVTVRGIGYRLDPRPR